MRYRTKLYIALLAISLVSTLLALGIIYYETRRQLLSEIRSKVTTVAATAAVFVDGELLKGLKDRSQESSPAYIQFREELRKARDANRRGDIYVKYIYTLMPDPNNPSEMIYGVDAEENPVEISHIGDVYITEATAGLLKDDNLEKNYSPSHFISDQFGTWLTGFAPIHDKEGKYVATLGVDIRATDVLVDMYHLLRFEFFALAGSIVAAVFGAFFLSRRATRSLNILIDSVDEIGKGKLDTRVHLKTNDEFNVLANAINHMAKGLQERERMKMNFAHYVSNHVLERILQTESPLKLEGERKKITVLFSDIREFTTFAEKQSPEIVVATLNEYFESMINIIFKNYGTLDKFLGDGLMVEFGAPLDDELQEKHALDTAVEMQEALEGLRKKWKSEGKPLIHMGIGIHTGVAVVGTIGSEKRMEYTAIGDTVNVAARIEGASKELKVPILVSETTYNALKNEFAFTNLGPISLEGRTEAITVYSIKK